MQSKPSLLQQLFSNSLWVYCIQIFIVLSGTTLGLFFLGHEPLIIPVTLGAIATALTDFDDRLSIRLRNLVYVCILFFGVSSILELLHPYQLLSILYLSCSSALFILMGALGQRYATISFGTILLSIYTLFGIGEYNHWYTQPSYFVLGALYYGLSAIIFYLLKPTQAIQDNLAQSFEELAKLFRIKAKLFDPDNTVKVEQLLYQLSLQNSQVVQSLNLSKRTLLTRLKASRANKKTIESLELYFLAQDIHEQATSNYLHYQQIQQQFSRTDVIFRIQKNIHFLATACEHVATSILQQHEYIPDPEHEYALTQLQYSINDWTKAHPNNIEVKNLQLILKNLTTLFEQLNRLNKHAPFIENSSRPLLAEINLLDDDIQNLTDLWLKIKQQLNPQSALFRHAVRIGFVFAAGSLLSLLPFAKHGYWILLTSLFVCQISYFATKSRLKLRTLGTILGVIIGVPVLYLVPSVEGQLILTIIFGVCFFYLRSKKYAMATLMATLMVMLIFNLKGAGYSIMLPRVIDTLLGCFVAWFAVSFIWPDWNFRNISRNIQRNLTSNLEYFDAVVQQYQTGRNNSIHYQHVRRAAHNAQIELSNMISSLSTEPNPNAELVQTAFRYLVYSHSQLSYISALGSHRLQLNDSLLLDLMSSCQSILKQSLLEQHHPNSDLLTQKLKEIEELGQKNEHTEYLALILKQLSLLLETLPELARLKNQLLQLEIR